MTVPADPTPLSDEEIAEISRMAFSHDPGDGGLRNPVAILGVQSVFMALAEARRSASPGYWRSC